MRADTGTRTAWIAVAAVLVAALAIVLLAALGGAGIRGGYRDRSAANGVQPTAEPPVKFTSTGRHGRRPVRCQERSRVSRRRRGAGDGAGASRSTLACSSDEMYHGALGGESASDPGADLAGTAVEQHRSHETVTSAAKSSRC